MRLIAAVVLAVLALASGAVAQTGQPGRYETLVARLDGGDVNVDYGALREAYTETSGYNPYIGPSDAALSKLYAAFNAGRFDEAVDLAQQVLAKEYVSIDAHAICDLSYRALKDARAERHHAIAVGLLESIRGAGDGGSPETAFSVIAVREEYSFMRLNGLKPSRQSLVNRDGHSYDAMDVTDRNGDSRTIYFNVDRPFAWAATHMKK